MGNWPGHPRARRRGDVAAHRAVPAAALRAALALLLVVSLALAGCRPGAPPGALEPAPETPRQPPEASEPAPESPRQEPIPAVSPAAVEQERSRLLAEVRWAGDSLNWRIGPLPHYTEAELSPDGRWLALVARGPATPAGWGLDLLLIWDLESGVSAVAAQQVRHPGLERALRAVGWREGGGLIVLRDAGPGPGGEAALAVDEIHPSGGSRRLTTLAAEAVPGLHDQAWLSRTGLYLLSWQLWRVDLQTGEARVLRERMPVFAPNGEVIAAISPDGERLLYDVGHQGLMDVVTGRELPLAPPGGEHGWSVWSPDGRRLAQRVSTPEHPGRLLPHDDAAYLLGGAVRILNRDGEEQAIMALPDGLLVHGLAWTPDGQELVAGAVADPGPAAIGSTPLADGGLYLLHPEGGTPTPIRPPAAAGRRLEAVGPGWALESGFQGEGLQITAWAGEPPPAPSQEGSTLVLPDGGLALLRPDGGMWLCAPGAPRCRQHAEAGYDQQPRVAGPWMLVRWWGDGGYFVSGVRWQP